MSGLLKVIKPIGEAVAKYVVPLEVAQSVRAYGTGNDEVGAFNFVANSLQGNWDKAFNIGATPGIGGILHGVKNRNADDIVGYSLTTGISGPTAVLAHKNLKNPMVAHAVSNIGAYAEPTVISLVSNYARNTKAAEQQVTNFADAVKALREKKDTPIVVNVQNPANTTTTTTTDTPVTKLEATITPKDSLSDKLFNYGAIALGVGGLGLGGYAIYQYIKNNKAKAKVKLKGRSDDPYDDVEVEVPMDQLNVSNTMNKRVNSNVRRAIQDSNRFSSRKKDKETGKLISYEEYLGKYGDPDKSKEGVMSPLEKQSSYIPLTKKQQQRIKEEYDSKLINKGIGTGIGALLGGLGGYVFGSQAFRGNFPSDYSPGLLNTTIGTSGLVGGGLLGGYLADRFINKNKK